MGITARAQSETNVKYLDASRYRPLRPLIVIPYRGGLGRGRGVGRTRDGGVPLGVEVGLGVAEGVAVGVLVGVTVGVPDGVGVGVIVAVGVGEGVGVGPGVPVLRRITIAL
jgi:hypothetical protein